MRFEIKAIADKGEIVSLELEAANESTARETAAQRGYTVLTALARPSFRDYVLPGRTRFPVLLFSVELLALIEAGLTLIEALRALLERRPEGEMGRVLRGVTNALYEGEPFSQALVRFAGSFSPLYIATIRASEQTGALKEALSRYIAYHEDLDRVRKKLVAASIYPAILIAVSTLVLLFLVLYVVPRFAGVYEGMSIDLPFFSRLLLATSRWTQAHWGAVIFALAAAAGAAFYLLSLPRNRARLNQVLWRLPGLGERMKAYQLARMYRTLGMLLRAGMPVVRSIEMASDLLARHLRERLERAKNLVQAGRPLSAAFAETELATPISLHMMSVGERSGGMGDMMERIARFCDEENARYVDALTRVFEPLLMTVLGLAVGTVVVLMYMPIFELAGSLQ
jgi:general secretion pathway protein F